MLLDRLSSLTNWFTSRKLRVDWVVVGTLLAVTLLLKLPALTSERAPFLFCDETMFFGQVNRLLGAGGWESNEFRAGGFNIYPALILVRIFEAVGFAPGADSVLLLGRVLMTVLVGSAGVVAVYFTTRMLCSNRSGPFFATLIFAISPYLLGVSRFWYPDHYLASLVAISLFLLVRTYKFPKSTVTPLLLGISIGIAVSTKYTAIALLGPALLIIVSALLSRQAAQTVCLRLVAVLTGAIVVTVLLNFSALLNPEGFWDGFAFNLNNYGATDGSLNPKGIGYYVVVVLFLVLPPLFILPVAIGVSRLLRSEPILLAGLLIPPLVLVLYLGSRGVIFNRNMTLVVPFLLPLAGLGFERLWSWAAAREVPIVAKMSLIVLLIVPSIILDARSVDRSLSGDPRLAATAWITKNLPANSIVGTNEACSGLSPAQAAGLGVVVDPSMEEHLDYYVLNSYWASELQQSLVFAFDQRDMHFFNFANVKLVGPSGNRGKLEALLPDHYKLVRRFVGDGPEIAVFKRRGAK